MGTSNVNRLDYLGDAPNLEDAQDNQQYYEMNLNMKKKLGDFNMPANLVSLILMVLLKDVWNVFLSPSHGMWN